MAERKERNNIIAEIQELIQQIKNEYQEGVDFEIIAEGINKKSRGFEAKSPHLKKVLREKFDVSVLAEKDIFLDYHQSDLDYWFSYKIEDGNSDILLVSEEGGSSWWNETENCKQCNQPVSKKEGRIQQWNGRKKTNGPSPNIIAHFHPECAKEYFANKGKPNQKNISRLKEKLLRNLDKISFDQGGHLANTELLKLPFEYGTWKKERVGVYRIKIDNEEINLRDFDRQVNEVSYLEIRNAIVSNIKQNISDWEIKKDEHNVDFLENRKTGVKVWTIIFDELVFGEGEKKVWTAIEALLKNAEIDREQIKQCFQKYNIKKIRLVDKELVIEYNNKKTLLVNDNQELQAIRNYSHKYNKKEITWDELKNINRNNNSTNNTKLSQFENKYLWLAGGVSVVGILIVLVSCYRWNRKRKIK